MTQTPKRDTERLQRTTQTSRRIEADELPNDAIGAAGEERLLKRTDGNHDLAKKMGDRWVQMPHEILTAKVSPEGVILTIGGKRYKIALEEVK